ncbi:hypothetical protein GQ457_02G020310 [Hibiscus cannabinus]
MCAAQAYILRLIGGMLMPDKSSAMVHTQYLKFLNLSWEANSYSWGSAILSFLYRELCKASKTSNVDGRALNADIGGCMVLLQSWAWYIMPFIAPICAGPSEFPLATRWHNKKEKRALEHKVTIEVRMLIDKWCESQNSRPKLTTQADRDAWFLLFPSSGLRRGTSGSGSSSSAAAGGSRGARGRRVGRGAAEPEPEPEPEYAHQVEEGDVQFDTGSYAVTHGEPSWEAAIQYTSIGDDTSGQLWRGQQPWSDVGGNFGNCYVPQFIVSQPQSFDTQPVGVDYMSSVMATTSLSSPLVSTGVGGVGPSIFTTPRRMNVESEEDSDDEDSGDDGDGDRRGERRVRNAPRRYDDTEKYVCECTQKISQGCKWKVRVSKKKRKQNAWELSVYNRPHTCCAVGHRQDHPNLDSTIISLTVQPIVQASPKVTVAALIGHVRSVFHYEPEYKKTWRGKDKAIRKLHGDWDASYNDLPAWINIMQKYNPGTIADLETLPSYMNDRVVQEVRQFHRLFWTFPQCIKAFKSCKPIIQVDGTFLYGRYKQVLLLAVVQDGNRKTIPIAFALVPREDTDSCKYGHMTTNLAEAINSSLKGIRNLPITAIVKATYFRLGKVFATLGKESFNLRDAGHIFHPRFQKELQPMVNKSNGLYVLPMSRSDTVFRVTEIPRPLQGYDPTSYRVNLEEKWCDCGYFQALKSPCQHAIAAYNNCRRDYKSLVDLVYFLHSVCKVYEMEFPAIGSETEWHSNQTWPTILPDPQVHRDKSGRPNSTRIHNAMDMPQRERTGQPKFCGHCRRPGHTIRKCPSRTQHPHDP